jgi:mRNA interferase RelE/StbE
MQMYEVVLSRSARKELEMLEPRLVQRIFEKIEGLSSNPRPRGCEKLKGRENLWRVRVGDYRIVYSIFDKQNLVDIMIIRHRKDAYESY